jgi:Transposase
MIIGEILMSNLNHHVCMAHSIENYSYCLRCHTDKPDRCGCLTENVEQHIDEVGEENLSHLSGLDITAPYKITFFGEVKYREESSDELYFSQHDFSCGDIDSIKEAKAIAEHISKQNDHLSYFDPLDPDALKFNTYCVKIIDSKNRFVFGGFLSKCNKIEWLKPVYDEQEIKEIKSRLSMLIGEADYARYLHNFEGYRSLSRQVKIAELYIGDPHYKDLKGFKRRKFSATKKARIALEAINSDLTVAQISSKYAIHTTQLNTWKKQALSSLLDAFRTKRLRRKVL